MLELANCSSCQFPEDLIAKLREVVLLKDKVRLITQQLTAKDVWADKVRVMMYNTYKSLLVHHLPFSMTSFHSSSTRRHLRNERREIRQKLRMILHPMYANPLKQMIPGMTTGTPRKKTVDNSSIERHSQNFIV